MLLRLPRTVGKMAGALHCQLHTYTCMLTLTKQCCTQLEQECTDEEMQRLPRSRHSDGVLRAFALMMCMVDVQQLDDEQPAQNQPEYEFC